MNFDPKVPMFPIEEQRLVINTHQPEIEMMLTAKDVWEWNDLREKIRNESLFIQEQGYIMLMGYIDNIIFPYKFCKRQ
jgi:hypothetical protein